MRKFLFWTVVAVLALASISQAQQGPVQRPQTQSGLPFNQGVFVADSLVSITASPAGLASGSVVAYRQPGRSTVFKIAGTAGGDTSLPIPAVNAVLDGFVWAYRATGYGVTIASGSTQVGMWLQGSYAPVPYKGTSWFDIAILDSVSTVPDTTNLTYRPAKSLSGRGSLIRGVQGDTIGRGVPWWRVRLKGNQAAAQDTSIHYIKLLIRYPHTQLR